MDFDIGIPSVQDSNIGPEGEGVKYIIPLNIREHVRTGREPRFSGHETALYSKDMLDALKSIAVRQCHHRLAELLGAAAVEAERLANLPEDLPLRK